MQDESGPRGTNQGPAGQIRDPTAWVRTTRDGSGSRRTNWRAAGQSRVPRDEPGPSQDESQPLRGGSRPRGTNQVPVGRIGAHGTDLDHTGPIRLCRISRTNLGSATRMRALKTSHQSARKEIKAYSKTTEQYA